MRKKKHFNLIGFGKFEEVIITIDESRPFGFYWVKYQGQWNIAEWTNHGWIFLGDIGIHKDGSFEWIHEDIIEKPNYL